MSYQFVSDVNQKEYTQFIENNPMVCYMQDYNWYKVKTGWPEHFHCGLYRDGELIAVCLLLSRNVFKGMKLFYSPRGYVIDFEDAEAVQAMTDNIRKLAKANHAYVVKIDPYFCISDDSFKENETVEHVFSRHYEIKHQNLINAGYKRNRLDLGTGETFLLRPNIAIPLCDTDLNILDADAAIKKCKSYKRYSGNYPRKRGIHFEVTDDISRVKDLADSLRFTEMKYNAVCHNEEYLTCLMEAFKGKAYLFFATLYFDEYFEFLKDDPYTTPEKLEEVHALQKAHGDSLILTSGLMLLPLNKKGILMSEYLYTGNNNHPVLSKMHAQASLTFEIMRFSIEHGCHYCNLGGVEQDFSENNKLLYFKKKFNGRLFDFAGEYDLPVSKMYYPIRRFYPLLLKLYRNVFVKFRKK